MAGRASPEREPATAWSTFAGSLAQPAIKREDIPQKLLELVDSMTNAEAIRFLSKIAEEGEHWIWKGWVNEKGYGRFDLQRVVDGREVNFKPYAHRLAFVLYYGVDIAHLEVNHKCWTPGCVRPDHLEALTWPEHDAVPRFADVDTVPDVPV